MPTWRVRVCACGLTGRSPINFARNSLATCSNIEITPLELQRFWAVSKNDRLKLCATFAGVVIAVTLGCCGQALRAATPSGPSGALRTSVAWCAVVLASPVSASRSVQNSPCLASWWRQRYKTLPACRKSAKSSHFGRAGRVLYRKWGRAARAGRVLYRTCGARGCAGRVLYRSGAAWFLLGEICFVVAPSVCAVAGLPPPTGAPAWPSGPSGALHASGGGGFAALGAGWRRVAGVSRLSCCNSPRLVVARPRFEVVELPISHPTLHIVEDSI